MEKLPVVPYHYMAELTFYLSSCAFCIWSAKVLVYMYIY